MRASYNTQNTAFLALVITVAAALVGMALVAFATTAGPGVGGDATIYLTTARSFLAGNGLGWTDADGSYRLLPYSPPLYPLALSGVGLLTRDLTEGARWLNVVMFGLTIFILGYGFYRLTGRAWLAGLLSGLLAASPVLVGVQVWAMTESIFMLTGFSGLLLLLGYLDSGRRSLFIASAVLVSLACLARYIGLAFAGVAGLALLFLPRPRSFSRRWQDVIWFGIITVLPVLAWVAYTYVVTGSVSSRSGQPASAYLQRFFEMGPALERIYLFWLLPDSVIARLPGTLRAVLWVIPLAALLLLAAWLARRLSTGPRQLKLQPGANLAVLFGLFILLYLVLLAVVQVFTYPPVTLASRMLSPVHLALLVLLAAMIHLVVGLLPAGGRWQGIVHLVLFLALLGLFGSYALRSVLIVRDYNGSGIGYNTAAWRDAPILDVVRALPASTPLITNEVTAIMYLAGRPAYALQEIYQDEPQAPFTSYGQGEDEAQRVFREQGGALVLFNATLRDDFAMYGERLDERLAVLVFGLRTIYEGDDGAIYRFER